MTIETSVDVGDDVTKVRYYGSDDDDDYVKLVVHNSMYDDQDDLEAIVSEMVSHGARQQ